MNRLAKSNREILLARDGSTPGPDFRGKLVKSTAQIPMRDGVTLYTEIYVPRDHKEALPIILERTPYGLKPDQFGYAGRLRQYPELIEEGYILVFQYLRGRFASGGTFIMLGPIRDRSLPNSTDESTDAYDTIDWLVKHVPRNNGRVGTLGISYGGFVTTRALVDPHPALKAASPQASPADMFIADDFHHNGAFRLDYTFTWINQNEAGVDRYAPLVNYDHYERFLELGALANINKRLLHGRVTSWNAFASHPNWDSFWETEMGGVLQYIQPVTVPTLNVVGWFDAEDFTGALQIYQKYESMDPKGLNYLVVGPWYHGGWSLSPDGRWLGPIDFGSNTSEWFRSNVQAPWFAYWLKDKGSMNFPEVIAFRSGENKWEQFPKWPPTERTSERRLYFQPGGSLSFVAPEAATVPAFDTYVSDPDHPVPHAPRPVTHNGWPEWQMVDQRFVDGRPDVLTYKTEPLKENVTISGEVVAHLIAATTGSDSDWVVKLIDVYPDPFEESVYMSGFQFMVANEVFRARYRNSFEKPEAVVPGLPTQYQVNLHSRNHTFKTGHRIMVQIQSTLFPLIDRNPQKYVDNIYEAVEGDFQKATQSIYRSAEHASYISLPVNTGQLHELVQP